MLDTLLHIALEAGHRVMEVYRAGNPEIQTKPDGSPVTRADWLSHEFICASLEREFGLPVVSEEAEAPPYSVRRDWDALFLVDPLDGTKDFIARNGEFTINIALIRGKTPAAGVVYVPASDELFFAETGQGAWWRQGPTTLPLPQHQLGEWTLARSWFYDNPTVEAFAQRNGIAHNIKMSSAIRLPRLAQGRVNLCLVSNRSSEWDIAAGHCLVREAGGRLMELDGGDAPQYNKSNLKNAYLLALTAEIDPRALKFGD